MAFSADWLALREPADQAARDAELARRAAAAAGSRPVVLDLGCGTGATRRALQPYLPDAAHWRFIDSDPALLALAAAEARGSAEVIQADIADIDALPLASATLVTASALLDLVPAAWLQHLARRLRVPFYAALSYSGEMRWAPEDARDSVITDFFNRHQQGDKGLGPAMGPAAGEQAASILSDAGFDVYCAASPWSLGPESVELQRQLTDGIAAAAAEAGSDEALPWGRERRLLAPVSTCEIGHLDILAIPRRGSEKPVPRAG